MFFTYLFRELRRRRRQAALVSLGLAVGVGLVVTVESLTRTLDSVFQNHALMPTLTAAENVQAPLVPLDVPWSEAHRRAGDNQSAGSQAG